VTVPLWLDPAGEPRPPLAGDRTTPVAILGGGITGISTAYWLAQQAIPSLVLERDRVGSGATGRNAGFLLEGPVPDYPDLVATWGRAAARALWDFTIENARRLREAVTAERIECGLVGCGSVLAAASVEEMADLERQAALLAQDGYPCEVLDRRALADELSGAARFQGGLRNSRDAGLHPARFVRGVMSTAERSSAVIVEHTAVTGLERDGPTTWIIRTPSATVRAERVVLSLNAYTSLIDPAWRDLITPVRGQVLATAPAARVLFRRLFYANRGFEYWRQLPGGEIVLGGLRHLAPREEVGTQDVLHARIQDALEGYLRDLGAPPFLVTHRWSGIMGFTPDRLPLIGPVPGREGLYIAGGYTGHGLAFAFLAGRMIAQLIAAGATDYPRVLFPERLLRS
jgi:glycine/D-amino acid oxidase-like deaminating enzyme